MNEKRIRNLLVGTIQDKIALINGLIAQVKAKGLKIDHTFYASTKTRDGNFSAVFNIMNESGEILRTLFTNQKVLML